MATLIKALFFDNEVVENIKKSNIDENFLYTQVISGKITLQEYLAACR